MINEDIGHLYRIEDCVFIDGIFELAKEYQDKGYLIIIVTNQAGIAKGMYAEQEYFVLRDWMHEQFRSRGVEVTAEYYCPHHPDYTGTCECRKPKPGMILRAAQEHNIDLAQSLIIGDKQSDIETRKRAGICKTLLAEYSTRVRPQVS